MSIPLKIKPLFTESQIQSRISELAKQIDRDYAGEEVVVVSVMKGAFIFTADLVRAMSTPTKIEFIGVSSYEGTRSTGHVRISHDLTGDVTGCNVLLVEDIIDTGKTIDYLLDSLSVREPKSLKICSFLIKPEVYNMRHKIDYTCFEISKEFVVGYGLDLDNSYRGLPYLGQIIDT